jgi:hypothetical protein
MTTEIKNEVALWALAELKRRVKEQYPDPHESLSRLDANERKNLVLDGDLTGILQRYDDSLFKAYAQAVEVAGRLELVARSYIYPNLPSEEDAAAYATHAAAMIATPDPIKCEALTKAVNAVCTCGGGPPGECCQACEVYHMVKAEQGDEEAEEAVEEVPK